MKKLIILFGILLMAVPSSAQKKNAKVEFEVAGVCEMCKQRIEKAALETKGVKSANWSIATHKLTLIIDERKTDPTKIKKNIAAVGHSTREIETTEVAYDKLDECCKYNDEKVVKDHEK